MTKKILPKKILRRCAALWLVFLWMPAAFSSDDSPIPLKPSVENEKAALLEMMAYVSELEGSQIPALKVVKDKAEALIKRLRSKEDPVRKEAADLKDAELIDTKILKPIEGLIRMGKVLEACGRGEEPLLSGLGRQFVRAMVDRLNIGECRDLEAIATPPEIIRLSRDVSEIEKAALSRTPRPKVEDSELFEKIWQKSREMAIVSYFKEYSRLQGEIHFDLLNRKVTQESADAYFRITGENILEPETFKSFFSQEKRGVGAPLSEIHRARSEEFIRSQKSSYEEFVTENREAYRKEVEKALKDLSQVKKEVLEAEEKVRSFKHLHNARFMLRPDELTALESSTEGRVRRYEGPRLTRRGPYGGFYRFDEIAAPETETGRYDAYDGVTTLSSNPIDVDYTLRRAMLPPEMMFPPSPGLEEGERLFLAYLGEKGVGSDFSRARELGYYAGPDIVNPREKFESFLNDLIPGGFSQFEGYLDSQLKSLREKSRSYQVSLDKDALTELLQKGLAQVSVVDAEGRKVPGLENARERLAQSRSRYEVLKSGIYRNFMVVRHDPEIRKMWENDEAKPISSDSVAKAWEKYDASMQEFLKETLLKAEGEKDPKKQIKLALKYHPSAVLGALLDDPRIEVAKRICDLGNEIKVDELKKEASRLTWGLGATLAVGASAALTYGMGPLFGYGLGFGAYGDAIFAGTATAVGGGHMLFKSIPDYQALALEGEVMEDILLALGEGDPRDVADKMDEINARFVELIGEGGLNAVGALGFIRAARNIPASLRAEAIRRELEALGRIRQGLRRIAEENIKKGVGKDFDKLVVGKKPVWRLNNDERIVYGEKVLGYKPGVIKNTPKLRNALLDAHHFDEAKLGEELLSRGKSLSKLTDKQILYRVIRGKAKRLSPFAPSERRVIMENGIAGDEAFIKGTPPPLLKPSFFNRLFRGSREIPEVLEEKGVIQITPPRALNTEAKRSEYLSTVKGWGDELYPGVMEVHGKRVVIDIKKMNQTPVGVPERFMRLKDTLKKGKDVEEIVDVMKRQPGSNYHDTLYDIAYGKESFVEGVAKRLEGLSPERRLQELQKMVKEGSIPSDWIVGRVPQGKTESIVDPGFERIIVKKRDETVTVTLDFHGERIEHREVLMVPARQGTKDVSSMRFVENTEGTRKVILAETSSDGRNCAACHNVGAGGRVVSIGKDGKPFRLMPEERKDIDEYLEFMNGIGKKVEEPLPPLPPPGGKLDLPYEHDAPPAQAVASTAKRGGSDRGSVMVPGWDEIRGVFGFGKKDGQLSKIAIGKSYEVKLKGGELFRGHFVKKVTRSDGQPVYMFEESAGGEIRSADEIRSFMPEQIEGITEAKATVASPRFSAATPHSSDASVSAPTIIFNKPTIDDALVGARRFDRIVATSKSGKHYSGIYEGIDPESGGMILYDIESGKRGVVFPERLSELKSEPAFQSGDTIHFTSKNGNLHRVTFKGYKENGNFEVILPGKDEPQTLPIENIQKIIKVEKPTTG